MIRKLSSTQNFEKKNFTTELNTKNCTSKYITVEVNNSEILAFWIESDVYYVVAGWCVLA